MASTEEQLCRGSGQTVGLLPSFHCVHYPSSCTEEPDFGCQEDLGDLHDPLEEVNAVKSDDQPPSMGTDPDASEIAWRSLDLMFPREDCGDDWSDWSEREGEDDVDDGQVNDGNNDADCPGNEDVNDCSTEQGSDEDDDCQGQVIDEEETNCPGKHYPKSDADEIHRKWLDRYCNQLGDHADICNEIMAREGDDTLFPPHPLKVFPDATARCILGGNCYHRVYKTHDTSPTASTLGYCKPKEMVQFFSVCLSSSTASYPISVYGIFAIRDELDRQRNCIFNCPRDDALMIEKQDSFVLPLCSPSRGIYVHDRALLEVDLWVKEDGDGSVDKQLLFAYAEIEIHSEFNSLLYMRIPSDDCNLDIKFMALTLSVEAVIQVYAKVDHPCHVRFTALSTCYDDDEILLFDGKLSGNQKIFQHVVAVKANEKLDVLLKVDQSLFQWTFQDEHVGAVCSPDDSILVYGHFFVRVFFSPKDSH